jgi:hypothetical protein
LESLALAFDGLLLFVLIDRVDHVLGRGNGVGPVELAPALLNKPEFAAAIVILIESFDLVPLAFLVVLAEKDGSHGAADFLPVHLVHLLLILSINVLIFVTDLDVIALLNYETIQVCVKAFLILFFVTAIDVSTDVVMLLIVGAELSFVL